MSDLTPLRGHRYGTWMLTVAGKLDIDRQLPVSPRTVDALRTHIRDRDRELELDYDDPVPSAQLLATVFVPSTPAAQERHGVKA